ncbi:MAG: methyltransferase domain-containing protein [Candidatus Eisenbacteria bacterium]|nr:methyltransferase domain-containing protein [Candidatus Eisenbacteria bacterium]
MARNDWERFFDAHAASYMENVFTRATGAEVDFLIDELGLSEGDRVLDVGCGTGRHAVELAKRGVRVTGIDLSKGMLREAERAARTAGVELELIHGDATRDLPSGPFDAALSLCEGAFGLLGAGDDPIEHPLAILSGMADALDRDGRMVVTALNGLRTARAAGGEIPLEAFDAGTMTETSDIVEKGPDGEVRVTTRERGFVPTELALLARCAGLRVDALWGGTAGSWGRRPLELDEMEIMLVATKARD